MLDFYWVGNSGNWTDSTNHWSYTSGGSPIGIANKYPGKVYDADWVESNVHFDANSFTLDGQTVTLDDHADCGNMDWTGCLHSPSLVSTTKRITIYRSLTLIPSIDISGFAGVNATWYFYTGDTVGETFTIDFAGLTTNTQIMINLYYGNTYDLASDITAYYPDGTGIYWHSGDETGTINTNGYDITTDDLYFYGDAYESDLNKFTINLGSSTITITDSDHSICLIEDDVEDERYYTLNAGTSTIHFLSTVDDVTFLPNGKTLHKVVIDPGCYMYVYPESSFSVEELEANGTVTNPITLTVGNWGGTPDQKWYISKTSGTVKINYVVLDNCQASGGATWYACNCVNKQYMDYTLVGDEMLTNPNFDGNSDGWTLTGGASYSDGKILANGVVGSLSQHIGTLEGGKLYIVTIVNTGTGYSVNGWGTGSLYSWYDGISVLSPSVDVDVTALYNFLNGSTAAFDSVSVKEMQDSGISSNSGWIFSCNLPYVLEGEPMDTGVYTLGRHSTSYPIVLDLTYPISERDGTDLVLDGVEIGSILIDDDDVYVTWKRTTDGIETFGIDKIDSDNKLSGAYFETRVLSGNREQLGNFSKFIISYGELPTGTDIIVSYSKNYGTDWNTMTTKKDIDRKLLYCEEEFEASSVAYRAVITATGNDAPAIERADIIMR